MAKKQGKEKARNDSKKIEHRRNLGSEGAWKRNKKKKNTTNNNKLLSSLHRKRTDINIYCTEWNMVVVAILKQSMHKCIVHAPIQESELE